MSATTSESRDDRLVPAESFVSHVATEWHQTVLEHKETLSCQSSSEGTGSLADEDLAKSETYVDEYSDMTEEGETMVIDEFELESGRMMEKVPVRYMYWGELNHNRDNAIVVCHALTGNADAGSWWGDMIGPGKALDTDKYFVFCANVLGSCYGTCGPTSINPATGKSYSGGFPLVTVRDSVKLHAMVLDELGAAEVVSVVGGSMGGMQALEWTFQQV